MSEKQRMPLAEARSLALEAIDELGDYCERIEIAGSIHREKPDVGDIELVCIPRYSQTDLLGDPAGEDDLTHHLRTLVAFRPGWGLRKDARGRLAFGPKNKLLTYRGFALDVFSATAKNFGMAMFVRTGPAGWNVSAMRRFRQLGMYGHVYAGVTDHDGREIDCPSEEDVFRLLRWEWVEPRDRG